MPSTTSAAESVLPTHVCHIPRFVSLDCELANLQDVSQAAIEQRISFRDRIPERYPESIRPDKSMHVE
jgi:hypothetical protein